MTTVWPSTRRRYAFHPSLRRLLQRHPRQAQEGHRPGRTLLSGRGTRGGSDTRRTVPRRPPAPLGGADPPRLRGRSPRLSSLRKRDARDRLHHTARPHRPHPRPPSQTREDPSPASALRAASGHPRLSSAPRPPSGQEQRQTCRPGKPSPRLHAALGGHVTEEPSQSWPSRWPRSPRHRPSPAAPTSAAGRGAQAPKRKFLSLIP
jgi:hypothetical protein